MKEGLDRVRARGGYTNFVDLDGDNTLDFYHYGYRDGGNGNILHDAWPNFMVLNKLGEGIAANQAPSAPANFNVEETKNGYLLTWDAAKDDITPAAAMRYNVFMKSAEGTFFLAQADRTTGKLSVGGAAIPTLLTGTSYEFKVEKGDYAFGIQAVDQSNATSAFVQDGEGTAVESIVLDQNVYAVYDLMGRKVTENQTTGIYIIKFNNGTSRKVVQ
jgi:hypothetical protein